MKKMVALSLILVLAASSIEATIPSDIVAAENEIIVKNDEDDSLNDAIYDMITKEIKGIKDKSKMGNIKDTLKKIREKEEAYNEGYKDLDNLINNL